MTIRELYEWADENGALDYDVRVSERDGGYFTGGSFLLRPEYLEIEDDEVCF